MPVKFNGTIENIKIGGKSFLVAPKYETLNHEKHDRYQRVHCDGCAALDTVIYISLALVENGFSKDELIFSEGSKHMRANRGEFQRHRCFRHFCDCGIACTYKEKVTEFVNKIIAGIGSGENAKI